MIRGDSYGCQQRKPSNSYKKQAPSQDVNELMNLSPDSLLVFYRDVMEQSVRVRSRTCTLIRASVEAICWGCLSEVTAVGWSLGGRQVRVWSSNKKCC